MWKYVSRRIRDTFERSVNHFDKRGTTGVVTGNANEENNKRSCPPCCWVTKRRCCNSFQQGSNTNNNHRWNFEQLTSSWIGAITWSSALVIGWYTSQLIHLKYKYQARKYQESCPSALLSSLTPYVKSANKNPVYLNSVSKIEEVISQFTPTVHLISNDQDGDKERTKSTSSNSTIPDSSDDALGDVLNSIENKLGLAAIENGQLQDGLNLLRSAANRNHAPALYNLGLCYEMGLGVKIDEKVAMEMYRSAAILQHPGALYNLGIYYGQGRGGLDQDTVTATRFLRLAAIQGQQDAIDALKSLELDNEPQHNAEVHSWSYNFNHQYPEKNIVPTPTTLFMENVNCPTQKYEASVY